MGEAGLQEASKNFIIIISVQLHIYIFIVHTWVKVMKKTNKMVNKIRKC